MHKKWVCLLALPLLWAGCVKEDPGECPPLEEFFLRVVENSADITDSGRVLDATVFVFDENRRFLTLVEIPGEELDDYFRIPLDEYTGERLYVSAWGNINSEYVGWQEVNSAMTMSDQFLYLATGAEEGFWSCPGEIFFGTKEIDLSYRRGATRAAAEREIVRHRIDIASENARLAITVVNLPGGGEAEDYYFRLGKQNTGYNFLSDPIEGDFINIKERGVFDNLGRYVSPAPYYLVHSVDATDDEDGMILRIFQESETRAGEDIDLTGPISAVSPDEGAAHIGLPSGQVTNVLVRFNKDGEIVGPGGARYDVSVVVTPEWEGVHDWSIGE